MVRDKNSIIEKILKGSADFVTNGVRYFEFNDVTYILPTDNIKDIIVKKDEKEITLYKEDFVIVNSCNMPLEGLDTIYHYTSIIDLINDGQTLKDGIYISMLELPIWVQLEYKRFIAENK